jgi:hypothetical protein
MKLYLLELGADLQGASTTSRAIGTGAHSFTLAADTIGAPPGLDIVGTVMTADAGAGDTMEGTVTAYDPATRVLALNVTAATGSGTHASWTIGGVATLRYSGGNEGYAAPSAPSFYAPRLVQPARLRRSAFTPGRVGGAVDAGFGDCLLANADGELDPLRGYGFAGQAFVQLVGDSAEEYGDFVVDLRGKVDLPTPQWNQFILRLRDRLEDFRRPLQPVKYAGSNTGGPPLAGVEGTENDLKGAPKPVAAGKAFDVVPRFNNTDRKIYQVHEGAVQDVPNLYMGGKPLTPGSDYASQADMEANAPSAGGFRKWKAGGMCRIADAPTGMVTADVEEGANAAARTVAQILKRLATRTNGIDAADVNAADVTALDLAATGEVGLYVDGETTILDAMNAIAVAAGVWFGFDRLNELRMKQLTAPAGSPSATLTRLGGTVVADASTIDLVSIDFAANADRDLALPVWRVVVGYKKCYGLQPSGFDAAADEARKAFLASEFRATEPAENAAVKAKHPAARELRINTPLVAEADAIAERDRLLVLHGVERDLMRAQVVWDAVAVGLIDLGTVVRVVDDRHGLSAGKLFVVVDIDPSAAGDFAHLGLWG